MPNLNRSEAEDGLAIVQLVLPSGHLTIFDAPDRETVEQYRWYANINPAGNVHVRGTRRGAGTGALVLLHRLLLDAPPGALVDHVNGDGLDNRRANLRLATNTQNCANRRLPRQYKGVGWDSERGQWRARITIGRRTRSLGRFVDPWDAAQAYNAAALEAWGEFAYLNERVVA